MIGHDIDGYMWLLAATLVASGYWWLYMATGICMWLEPIQNDIGVIGGYSYWQLYMAAYDIDIWGY